MNRAGLRALRVGAFSALVRPKALACLAVLILTGFLEIEMDEAPIGPETVVRRIRD